MPVTPEVPPEIVRKIIETYAETERLMVEAIARRLERGIDGPNWYETKLAQTQVLRRELEAQLARSERTLRSELRKTLARAYTLGVKGADADIAEAGLEIAGGFVSKVPDSVRIIAEDVMGTFQATRFPILRQSLDAYRIAVSEAVPGVAAGGLTRREASERVLQNFARTGIKGFTDRAGRRWNLDSYAEMTVRTAAGRVQIEAAVQRFQGLGPEGDLVIVSDSPEECPLCRPWEGKVLSTSGRSRTFDPLSTAITAGLFHPNCTHGLGLFVPGLTKPPGKTENPTGYEDRQRQREIERHIRHWKRREAGALTEETRKRARTRSRAWSRELGAFTEAKGRKRLRYRER